jgi:hypothetical protein
MCRLRRMTNLHASELNRSHRSDPVTNFGGILLVHVEEVRHHRFHDRLTAVIRLHGDDAAEDLEPAAVPVFEDVVMGCETRIDEGAQVLADGLASMPIGNTEVTDGIFGKSIEPFTKGLVVNLLPESH